MVEFIFYYCYCNLCLLLLLLLLLSVSVYLAYFPDYYGPTPRVGGLSDDAHLMSV